MRAKLNFLFLVIPPIFVLGSPGFTVFEYLYSGFLLLNVFVILTHSNFKEKEFRLLAFSSGVIAVLILVGVAVSLLGQLPVQSYASVVNFLVAGLWLFVIPRASMDLDIDFVLRAIMIIGLISAFGTYYKWSQLRGYESFRSTSIALDADWTAYLLIITCVTFWNHIRAVERIFYLGFTLFSIALLLSTGTRTYIFVFFWITLALFISSKSHRRPLIYLVSSALILLTVFTSLFSKSALDRYSILLERVSTDGIQSILFGIDNSTLERALQREYFIASWNENFLFGKGLIDTISFTRLYADTPFATISKIGLLGLILIFTIICSISFALFFRFDIPQKPFLQTYTVFISILIPISFAYDWLSNKSFWLAFSCTIGLALNARKTRIQESSSGSQDLRESWK